MSVRAGKWYPRTGQIQDEGQLQTMSLEPLLSDVSSSAASASSSSSQAQSSKPLSNARQNELSNQILFLEDPADPVNSCIMSTLPQVHLIVDHCLKTFATCIYPQLGDKPILFRSFFDRDASNDDLHNVVTQINNCFYFIIHETNVGF